MALQHFKNFYNNVGYPISLSRGAYWIGNTYKIMKNKQKSEEWFNEASKYLNTYYGQLAYMKLYPNEEYTLVDQVVPSMDQKKKFYRKYNLFLN